MSYILKEINFLRKKIKQILNEEFEKSFLFEEDDLDHDFYDLYFDMKSRVMDEYLEALNKEKPESNSDFKAKQKWETIPFSTFKRQWEEFIKWGYVKPTYEKTLQKIQDVITKNVLKVTVNTELAGHTPHDPTYDWIEHLGDNFPKDKIEYIENYFGDFIEDENGQLRISDYGLESLQKKVLELRKIHDPAKKLVKIDEILNVIHQRSDIAGWFIEGGTRALNKLSGLEEVYDGKDVGDKKRKINTDYFQKVLDSARMSHNDRQYYQKIIDTVKKNNKIATVRQYMLLKRMELGGDLYSTKN